MQQTKTAISTISIISSLLASFVLLVPGAASAKTLVTSKSDVKVYVWKYNRYQPKCTIRTSGTDLNVIKTVNGVRPGRKYYRVYTPDSLRRSCGTVSYVRTTDLETKRSRMAAANKEASNSSQASNIYRTTGTDILLRKWHCTPTKCDYVRSGCAVKQEGTELEGITFVKLGNDKLLRIKTPSSMVSRCGHTSYISADFVRKVSQEQEQAPAAKPALATTPKEEVAKSDPQESDSSSSEESTEEANEEAASNTAEKIVTEGKFTKFELTSSITVRQLEDAGRKDYLDYVAQIPKGATIAVNLENKTSPMNYKAANGKVLRSQSGWYRGLYIVDSNGKMSKSEVNKINKLPLYISTTFLEDAARPGSAKANSADSSSFSNADANCYDTFVRKGVPERPLKRMYRFLQEYGDEVPNKEWMSFVDYSVSSKTKRFYLLDMNNCKYYKEYVAHGSGLQYRVKRGDPEHDGYLNRCKYQGRTQNMTREGMQIIKGWHYSRKRWPILNFKNRAKGLKLHGLEKQNREVFRRAVVMHEQRYVSNRGRIQGRSFGCPAFAPGRLKYILRVSNGNYNKGTLFYVHAPMCQ